MPLVIALDYSILDHLQRLDAGNYTGPHADALARLRASAERGRVEIWIPEISEVEMIHGIEHVAGDPARTQRASTNDAQKREIAHCMRARTLAYPCSQLGDNYSRLGVSFRLAGPDTGAADELEQRLLAVPGISPGDARQLASCAFAFDGERVSEHPQLEWFVAHDTRLLAAVRRELAAGNIPELGNLSFGSATDLVAACPRSFD